MSNKRLLNLKQTMLTLAVLILLVGSQSCRKQPSNFINNTNNSTVEKLKEATQFADDDELIVTNYNHALNELDTITASCEAEDWVAAAQQYDNFQQQTRVRPQPKLSHPDISLALLDAFDLYNVQLAQAINREDNNEAAFMTNQLTNILNDLIMQIQANNGAEARRELQRLIFLHREMELWANRNDETMLIVRAARLRKAWTDLRPVVFDHHGEQAAAQFDEVAARLDKIDSIEDYQQLSADLTSAVTAVTAVFTEQR